MDAMDARRSRDRGEQRLERTAPRHCPLPAPAPFALVVEPSHLAPRIARRTLGRWLLELSCPTEFVEDVKLIVDELVTNVVVHARTPARVLASVDDGRLRHEVHDGSSAPLVVDPHRPTGGFGLRLVGVLTDDWGWEPVPGGKYVWTEIRFADPAGG
jgi:anti-sigma regulatory factor (Ser/Thr protein kinase)